MGFIRRLLGHRSSDAVPSRPTEADEPADPDLPAGPAGPADLDAAERAYELEVLRDEQARLGDLTLRQLRYARYAWQPPRQGGERRADDEADEAP